MAAIGSIRKHAVALMIIIGLALLAFIVGDLTQVRTVFSNKNVVAKIDGERMDKAYSSLNEQNTAMMRLIQNKSSFDESETYQIYEMTWRQMLQEKVLDKQLKALGMPFTDQMIEDFKAEMATSLNSQQPNQYMAQFVQALAAQVGGIENAISIVSNIEEIAQNEQYKEIYDAYLGIVHFAVLAEKYNRYASLAQGTVYFSDPIAKKLAADNKSAMVTLLTINPQAPAFKGIDVKVSENEMKDFYKKHKKDLFTVYEINRDIDVAIFQIAPTKADLKSIEDSVRADFQHFSEVSMLDYSSEKGSGVVDSTFYKIEDIQIKEGFDSLLFNLPVGSYLEPYNYNNVKWFFGKVFGAASRPDSVQVASVSLPFKTADNANAKYTKKQARELADSLKGALVSHSASIYDLQRTYMDMKGQDTTFWLPEKGTIADLYNNLLTTPENGIYVYKAPGGYVVFQVLQFTAPISKRQFVLYDYDIAASEKTVSDIRLKATQFASSVSSAEELVSKAAKQGIPTISGSNVLAMSSSISQLTNCRDIVSWAFSDDVKKNDISDPKNIERMYFAVAAVRNIRDLGVQSYKAVKGDIENLLKAEKKSEAVAEKVNSELASSSMESLGQKYSAALQDSVVLSFVGDSYQNRNVEPMAIGKIFNLAKGKTAAVNGRNMVYVVRVNDTHSAPASANLAMEKNILFNELMGRNRNEQTIVNYLINKTKVVDNRYKVYQK